jgi:pyruvate dehydrogenase E1 component alpha subunit
MERCPIKTYKERLLNESISTEKEITIIEDDVKKMVKEAVDFAIKSPYPKEEEAFEDLFTEQEGVR